MPGRAGASLVMLKCRIGQVFGVPPNNVPALDSVDVGSVMRAEYPQHLNKTLRHCKFAAPAPCKEGDIMLFNHIFSLTNPDRNGIVPGSVFCLGFNRVELWN